MSRPGFLNVMPRHRGAGNVCPHQAPTLCPLVSNSRGAFSCGDCSSVVSSPVLRRHLQVFLDSPSRPQCTVRVKVGAGRGWWAPSPVAKWGLPLLVPSRGGKAQVCSGAGGLEPHISPREGCFRRVGWGADPDCLVVLAASPRQHLLAPEVRCL